MGALVTRQIGGRDVLVDSDTGKVQLRDGNSGNIVEISTADLADVLGGGGYDIAERGDVKQYEQAGKPLQAAAEGVGRGVFQGALAIPKIATKLGSAAIGAEDPLQGITGASTVSDAVGIFDELSGRGTAEQGARVYGEDAEARAEANPFASGVGTLGGQLIGGGGVMGAGKLAGGLVAGRVASAGVAAATEGAIWGGSQATEDAAIADVPLTAGKMLASMGLGAFLGGGIGLTAGAIGRRLAGSSGIADDVAGRLGGKADDVAEAAAGGPAAAGRVADDAAQAAPRPTAGRVADDVAGQPSVSAAADDVVNGDRVIDWLTDFRDESVFKAVTNTRPADVVKLRKQYGLTRNAVKEVSDTLRTYEDDAGNKLFQTLGKTEDYAPKLRQAVDETGAKIGALRKRVDDLASPDIKSILAKIDDEVIAPLQLSDDMTERAMAERLKGEMDAFRPTGDAANDNASLPAGYLRLDRFRQKIGGRAGYGSALKTESEAAYSKQLQKLERAIDSELDETAKGVLTGEELTEYLGLQKTNRALRSARDISELRTGHNVGMRTFGMSDNQAGQAGAVIGTLMTGGVGGLAIGAASMVGNKLLRTYGRGVAATVADRLSTSLDRKIAARIDGFFRTSINSQAFDLAIDKGIARINSEGVRAAAAEGVAAATGAAKSGTRRAARAVSSAFMGKETTVAAAYEKRVAEVRQANNNFGQGVREAVATKLGDMPSTAPKLTMAITNGATRALNYLATQIPGAAEKPSPLQPGKKIPISEYEMAKFARVYAAVDNPLTVLDDLERGKVTFEQVDAIKAAWPEVYEDIRKHVLERIIMQDVKGKPLSYNAKAQLDIFLSLNGAGEPTLSTEFGAKVDGLRSQQAQQQQQTPPAKPAQAQQSPERFKSADASLTRNWSN